MSTSAVWLESPRFDVAAFFAPALVSVAAFGACALLKASPLTWLWVWIIAFDGPHMLATYSRAYGDRELWRTRRRLLLGSPLAFAVGPLILLASAALRVPGLFTAFLAVMSVYSLHHVVRQHWGFAALYAARSGQRPLGRDRVWFYTACWAPYAAFVLTHPALRQEVSVSQGLARAGQWAGLAFGAIAAIAILRYVLAVARAARLGHALQAPAYLLLVALFQAGLFLGVARFEPMFPQARGLDQVFMLVSLMNGMFHSAQYVALVGLFHHRSAGASPTWFAHRPLRALGVLVPFVVTYAAVACATGVYPGCPLLGRPLGLGIGSAQLALAIWWGFALHHYWLDERIWHVRSDPRLARVFGLET